MKIPIDILAERIRALREALRFNQDEFAAKVGVEQPTVSRWENKRVYPTDENLSRIAALANERQVDFDYGDSNLFAAPSPASPEARLGIPIHGEVAAGVWVEQASIEEPTECLTGFVPDERYKRYKQYALLVRGESMNKIIQDGEYVVVIDAVELGKAPTNDDIVVVERLRHDGMLRETTIKQVEIRDGQIILWPRSHDRRFQDPVTVVDDHEPDGTTVRITAYVISKTRRFL